MEDPNCLYSFCQDLHWLLWCGPALPLMAEHEGSWLSGQCGLVMEGFLKWISFSRTLPPSAVFPVIVSDARCPAHHVVVGVRPQKPSGQEDHWYLDANGISTKETLLRYWEEEGLKEPYLSSYDEQLLIELGFLRDGRISTRLADCFLSTFGRFSLTFLHDGPQS